MRLFVYVLEATGLPCPLEAYVKPKLGERKSRTRAVRGGADPVWNEEFVFRMEDEWGGDTTPPYSSPGPPAGSKQSTRIVDVPLSSYSCP